MTGIELFDLSIKLGSAALSLYSVSKARSAKRVANEALAQCSFPTCGHVCEGDNNGSIKIGKMEHAS